MLKKSIPPKIVIPTVSLLAAPGPDPIIKGNTLKIVDRLVIKIGLNRILDALITDSSILFPSRLS